jgi:radical SAM superfamily enzyme YgiQ (UPF0313 family)
LEEVKEYFSENQFDFVGISAVVSTAYGYTKLLSNAIREVSPHTFQILGGNLGASAEVILRKTEIQVCVIGDGELIIQKLIARLGSLQKTGKHSLSTLEDIKGLAFLDEERFVFTGYATPLSAELVSYPDYTILERDKSINHYMPKNPWWASPSIYNIDLKMSVRISATIVATKGCVARCTFCHRWEKGFRAKSASGFEDHIKLLRNKYGVSLITLGDENFGSDKRQTKEITRILHENGMTWKVAGVRVRTVDFETLSEWKKQGCVDVSFGIESGSQTMLDVMQKNATVEANSNAIKWTALAGLDTVLQIVIAMPGESDKTIRETRDFIISHLQFLRCTNGLPSNSLSINYAQALPGTALYEYALRSGKIHSSLDGEEEYLLKISDIDAYSSDHFVNYSHHPLLKVLMWRYLITAPADAYYIENVLKIKLSTWKVLKSLMSAFMERKFSFHKERWNLAFKSPLQIELKRKIQMFDRENYGYFNFKGGWQISLLFMKPLIRFSYPLLALGIAWKQDMSIWKRVNLILDHVVWSLLYKRSTLKKLPLQSLRTEVFGKVKSSDASLSGTMELLRMGR